MDEEPDFKGLGQAWVAGDARLRELDPDRREALAARLAEALDRRRRAVADQVDRGGHLIVSMKEDQFLNLPHDQHALSQLEKMIEEVSELD
jgi:hypothetical protein